MLETYLITLAGIVLGQIAPGPNLLAVAGAALGQTVLARAAQLAGLDWDHREAHSARYDAERTADLFCHVSNLLHDNFTRSEEKARAMGWKEGAPAPVDLAEEE